MKCLLLILSLLAALPVRAAYSPTPADQTRGYWLSGSSDSQQQPDLLSGTLRADLGLNDERSFYIGVLPTRTLSGGNITVQVSGSIASFVTVAREIRTIDRLAPSEQWSRYTLPGNPRPTGAPRDANDSIVFVPLTSALTQTLDATAYPLHAWTTQTRPAEYRLWLRFASNAAAGTYSGTLTLQVHGQSIAVPLELQIWPVNLSTAARPFDMQGYTELATYAGVVVNPATTAELAKRLDAHAAVGGNVMTWVNSYLGNYSPNIKYGPSGASLPVPGTVPLNSLPNLDFSHYDPWIDLLRQKLKRVETYVEFIGHTKAGIGSFLVDRPNMTLEEEKQILQWWLVQLKSYLMSRGFTEADGFFCKISDEIGPESVDGYIATAEIVRAAGWRPYTTIMGPLTRSSEYLNRLQPYCDEWKVSYGGRTSFDYLTSEKQRLEWKESVQPSTGWLQYGNGGALDTWQHSAIFGVNANGQPLRPWVDRAYVLQSTEAGVPLQLRANQSPWGNQSLGATYALGSTLYASRTDGGSPAGTIMNVRYSTSTSGSSRVWNDAAMTYDGQYTNGGARDTGQWNMGTFHYQNMESSLQQFLVLQKLGNAGAPLQYQSPYPWGNQKRGVFYRSGNHLYVSLHDGRPPANLLTLRYRKVDGNGVATWHDAPLSTYGMYTNGGATHTWLCPMPADATTANVDTVLVLQDVSAGGLPLNLFGSSPWGNSRLGAAFVQADILYVTTRDGRPPMDTILTVRYSERTLDPVNGSILAPLKNGDQKWMYSGYESTFAMPYDSMIANPLLAAIEEHHGYAVFGFAWFNDNRVVWSDGDPSVISTGPAYAALKDGYRDAVLIRHAVQTAGVITMNEVSSTSPGSLLPLTTRTAFDDPAEPLLDFTLITQQSLNAARRELLRRLSP